MWLFNFPSTVFAPAAWGGRGHHAWARGEPRQEQTDRRHGCDASWWLSPACSASGSARAVPTLRAARSKQSSRTLTMCKTKRATRRVAPRSSAPQSPGLPSSPSGVTVWWCASRVHQPGAHPDTLHRQVTTRLLTILFYSPPAAISPVYTYLLRRTSWYTCVSLRLSTLFLPTSWAAHKRRMPRCREWRIINVRASILTRLCPPLWGGKEACVTNHFCVSEFITEGTTFWINNCISRISRIYP